ncbi:acyl-CoA dehydrogenase family protein [Sphingomonas sinipercae]|uniref:Acyl-CoA dehydrogenase family protein n=1 Tax=Sphingomonas sinipercae TaxID=2714944 RepID=A0A6G7ZNP4_9SPHN|nr:acyl-CoA dehydrogenase family protein [Sphingomonas sinipercae]QIL02604.1 acyl-CoA dehydrogenase family protein [Sphingomonas sinipercae]
MADSTFLSWPFFEAKHRELADRLHGVAAELPAHGKNIDDDCRSLVQALGGAGLLKLCVADGDRRPDVRSLALARETLAYHSGLADFAFAMQGLGSGAISLFGTIEQKREWLPAVASGQAIAAFAMTEPECGSDAANIATSAMREGNEWVLVGEKTYISNGGIADFYLTFARTGEGEGSRGLTAFIVPADAVTIEERIDVIAPHPLARIKFDKARIPADSVVGEPGDGFRVGMETLNLFRVTVAAAALGFARRALDEALGFASSRRLGSKTLADNAVTQAKMADMATAIDASALLVYRAAWQQDVGGTDNRRAAAMAKLHATEAAQQVIDAAVQMHGGAGVTRGVKVEELYRDVRALRIYEGASEVQRQIIARDLLKEFRA